MHNNTEGLSPSLRAQLGVGWNRALPGPFGFGNGILPDGVNDEVWARSHTGQSLPNKLSFGIWFQTPASFATTRSFYFISTAASGVGLSVGISISAGAGNFQLYARDTANFFGGGTPLLPSNTYYVVINIDFVTKQFEYFINGAKILTGLGSWTGDPFANAIQFSGVFRNSFVGSWSVVTDECVLYNRWLTLEEVALNYNMGIGNNQANTEGILWWYDFQEAEPDTSLNPGGNPAMWPVGVWGLRDKSNNGYHGQQINFAANNSTLGGAIQPF